MIALTSLGSTATPVATTANPVPSTDGFLQTLDQILSGASSSPGSPGNLPSPLASLLGMDASLESPLLWSAPAAPTEGLRGQEDDQGAVDLASDPALCSQMALLLQALGFQVRPEQIAELSPLDARQMDSALEFVQRNIQRGVPVDQIAENAALLLPRPWPQDGLDGSPLSPDPNSQASEVGKLPENFLQKLSDARNQLSQASAPRSQTGKPTTEVGINPVAATPKTDSVQTAVDQGSKQGSFQAQDQPSRPQNQTKAGKVVAVDSMAVATFAPLQETTPSAQASDTPHLRRLPSGSLASELIGRQVLEKIQVQLSQGRQEISIKVWPEELGEVRLSLRLSEGKGVQATMIVENDAVRQAMLDSTAQLKDALSRHGMNLEKLSVDVQGNQTPMADSNADGGDGRQDGRHHRHSGTDGAGENGELTLRRNVRLGEDTGFRSGKNTLEIWS